MALRFCQAWHSCWDCWEWDLQDLPHVVEAFSRFLSGQRLLQCSMCWSCAKPLLHASSGHARSAAQVPSSFLFKGIVTMPCRLLQSQHLPSSVNLSKQGACSCTLT